MNKRIHACLDGELSPEALSVQEQAELHDMQSVIGAVADRLHAHPVPDFTRAVMQALPSAAARAISPAAPWQRALAWLWTPQTVHVRPAYGLAGVLLLALALPLAGRLLVPQTSRLAGAPAAHSPADGEPRVYVQFRIEAPDAEQVALAGSFTGWRPTYLLQETAPGVWTALVPLQPGVHDYAFVVDGRWVADPHAFQVPDSFGGRNSRISLPAPRESA